MDVAEEASGTGDLEIATAHGAERETVTVVCERPRPEPEVEPEPEPGPDRRLAIGDLPLDQLVIAAAALVGLLVGGLLLVDEVLALLVSVLAFGFALGGLVAYAIVELK